MKAQTIDFQMWTLTAMFAKKSSKLYFLQKKIYLFVYMWVWLHVFNALCAFIGACGACKISDPPDLSASDYELPIMLLRIKPRSSVRTISSAKLWCVCLDPSNCTLSYFIFCYIHCNALMIYFTGTLFIKGILSILLQTVVF